MAVPLLPLALGAGSLLGGVFGGLLSSSGQRSANAANLRIAQEQNALNYKMFQEQNAINERLWQLQNQYNTPLAQRKRLEDAGINPAIALGQISTGQASSIMSAQAQGAVGATMQNEQAGLAQGLQSGISSAIGTFADVYSRNKALKVQEKLADAQVLKSSAETAGILTDNKYKSREKEAVLKNIAEQTNKVIADTEYQKFNLDYLRKAEPDMLRNLSEDINVKISQQAVSKSVQALNEDTLRNMRPLERQQLQAQIANVYQSTLYLVQQGQVAAAQVDSLVQGVLESQARAGLIGVQSNQIKTLIQPTLRNLNAQANLYGEQAQTLGKQRSYMGQDNARQWISTITGGFRDVGIGIGSITGAAGQAGFLSKGMAPIGFVGTR